MISWLFPLRSNLLEVLFGNFTEVRGDEFCEESPLQDFEILLGRSFFAINFIANGIFKLKYNKMLTIVCIYLVIR